MISPFNFCARLAALGALAGGALVLSGCGGGGAVADPLPTDNSRISFTSFRSNDPQIYTVSPDGSQLSQLTTVPEGSGDAVQSSDRSKIAFASARSGGGDIYVMDANGKNQTRVTNSPAVDANPTWSPDGRQLAFSSNRDGLSEIYIMDADGQNVRRLTPLDDGTNDSFNPAWSPDGTRIAFERGSDSSPDIAPSTAQDQSVARATGGAVIPSSISVISIDGTNLRSLGGEFSSDPAWHPNSQSLIFNRSFLGLFTVDADGTNEMPLVEGYSEPDYSPDGKQIVAVAPGGIFVLNADGSNPRNIYSDQSRTNLPNWQ